MTLDIRILNVPNVPFLSLFDVEYRCRRLVGRFQPEELQALAEDVERDIESFFEWELESYLQRHGRDADIESAIDLNTRRNMSPGAALRIVCTFWSREEGGIAATNSERYAVLGLLCVAEAIQWLNEYSNTSSRNAGFLSAGVDAMNSMEAAVLAEMTKEFELAADAEKKQKIERTRLLGKARHAETEHTKRHCLALDMTEYSSLSAAKSSLAIYDRLEDDGDKLGSLKLVEPKTIEKWLLAERKRRR